MPCIFFFTINISFMKDPILSVFQFGKHHEIIREFPMIQNQRFLSKKKIENWLSWESRTFAIVAKSEQFSMLCTVGDFVKFSLNVLNHSHMKPFEIIILFDILWRKLTLQLEVWENIQFWKETTKFQNAENLLGSNFVIPFW